MTLNINTILISNVFMTSDLYLMSVHGGIISRLGDEDGKSSVSDVNNGQGVFVEAETDFFALHICIITDLPRIAFCKQS